jgi:hypothetical protein
MFPHPTPKVFAIDIDGRFVPPVPPKKGEQAKVKKIC